MESLFASLIQMSIYGSIAIVIVLLARIPMKRLPKGFSYALWSAPLLRLCIPLSIPGFFSFMPQRDQVMQTANPGMQFLEPMRTALPVASESGIPLETAAPPLTASVTLVEVSFTIWLIGVVCFLIYGFYSWIRLRSRLRTAVKLENGVYITRNIDTPFVMGVLHPVIYLPESLSQTEKPYILMHEEYHIRRKDPLVKLISFLVLAIHWFNPFVWVAFFASSQDMEMSCDEAVLRKCGGDIKKQYSNSLLSLASGRQTLGGLPLAFGEGNTKGRILHVLHYKKPGFWVVLIGAITVMVLIIGLMTDPMDKKSTIEDYAEQYVQQVIQGYETVENQNYAIVDSKITSLDQIASFDSILKKPIELWALGYRLKAEPADQVMLAGGMNQEDGWITEDSSMGKPILVVSGSENRVDFLGILWTGDLGSTQSGMEIALRKMLIEKGDLPSEFFPGAHGVAKFNLSTGEKAQLLLSQPAQKGKDGIWCVESWMDGNGTFYYHDPQVDQGLAEYYEGLQSSKSETQQGWMTDPEAVASRFIIETLGQPLPEGTLVLMDEASYEDYMITPVSRYIGYISSFGDPYPDMFHFDSIEWITLNDAERIRQLGINPEEMTNGFYIHNPRIDIFGFQVNDQTSYVLHEVEARPVSKNQFKKFLEEDSGREEGIPFVIETKDGYVTSITQQYLP